MNSRYLLAKQLYPNYFILIFKGKKLYTCDSDEKFYNYKELNELRRLHINYIILDDLDVYKKEYNDNNYVMYYLKYKFNYILNNILAKMGGKYIR